MMNDNLKIALFQNMFEDDFFEPTLLIDMEGWVEIKLVDEADGEIYYEPLDMENFEIKDYSEDTVTIICGGDWQPAHKVILKMINGVLTIRESSEIDEEDGFEFNSTDVSVEIEFVEEIFQFVKGKSYKEKNEKFVNEKVLDYEEKEIPMSEFTIVYLEKLLKIAVEREDFEEACIIRDEINSRK